LKLNEVCLKKTKITSPIKTLIWIFIIDVKKYPHWLVLKYFKRFSYSWKCRSADTVSVNVKRRCRSVNTKKNGNERTINNFRIIFGKKRQRRDGIPKYEFFHVWVAVIVSQIFLSLGTPKVFCDDKRMHIKFILTDFGSSVYLDGFRDYPDPGKSKCNNSDEKNGGKLLQSHMYFLIYKLDPISTITGSSQVCSYECTIQLSIFCLHALCFLLFLSLVLESLYMDIIQVLLRHLRL